VVVNNLLVEPTVAGIVTATSLSASGQSQRYGKLKRNIAVSLRTSRGIFQTTTDGRYISANPALASIYGYESPEELNLTALERQLYVEPSCAEFIRSMQEHNAISEFESQVYRRDGSVTCF